MIDDYYKIIGAIEGFFIVLHLAVLLGCLKAFYGAKAYVNQATSSSCN
jgi:hypothetical protein